MQRWAHSWVGRTTFALALAACDDAASSPGGARARSVDRAPTEAPAVPGLATGSDEDCAQALRAATPEQVRATLTTIGYDALFADTCLVSRAVRTGDLTVCDDVTMGSLGTRCRARVAIAAGRPHDCPPARTGEGRDPACVAVASHDRRLCVAAGLLEGAACAKALGQEDACTRLPEAVHAECETRAQELAAAWPGGDVRTTPHLSSSASLTAEGHDALAVPTADRGARIDVRACVRTLVLGDEATLGTPFSHGGFALVASLRGEAPFEDRLGMALGPGADATLALDLPGVEGRVVSGTVNVRRAELELGGRVEGSFHAVLSGGGATVDGTFSTFVRDLETRSEACPPDVP